MDEGSDGSYLAYVHGRLPALRRVAYLLSGDEHQADGWWRGGLWGAAQGGTADVTAGFQPLLWRREQRRYGRW